MIRSAPLRLLSIINDTILQLISLSRRDKVTSQMDEGAKDSTPYQVKILKELLQSMNEDNLLLKSKLSKVESELEFSKSQNSQLVNIAQRRFESIEDLQSKYLHIESKYRSLVSNENNMQELIAKNKELGERIQVLKYLICKLKADLTCAANKNNKDLLNLRQQHAEEIMRIKNGMTD